MEETERESAKVMEKSGNRKRSTSENYRKQFTQEQFMSDGNKVYLYYNQLIEDLELREEEVNVLSTRIKELEPIEEQKTMLEVQVESQELQYKLLEEALLRAENERCDVSLKFKEMNVKFGQQLKVLHFQKNQLQELSLMQQQLISAQHFINDAKSKLQTEKQLRENDQKQLDGFRSQVQKLASEKKHYLEKISKFEKETRQHFMKRKNTEMELRRLQRQLEDFVETREKMEKYEDLLELEAIENLELQKELKRLRRAVWESENLNQNQKDPLENPEDAKTQIESIATIDKKDNWSSAEPPIPKLTHSQSAPPHVRVRSRSLAAELEDCKYNQSPPASPVTDNLQKKRHKQTEDYLLMTARAIKIQYREVDVTFDQLVSMARGLKFWEVYPFFEQTMQTLRLKDQNMKKRNSGDKPSIFGRIKSFFGQEEGLSPTNRNRRSHSFSVSTI